MCTFIRVIIPLKINKLYTYKITNSNIKAIIGQLITVEFNNKIYLALIHSIANHTQTHNDIKEVLNIANITPIVNIKCIDLWEKMANYYMCTLSDIMILALPISLKPKLYDNIRLTNSTYNCNILNETEVNFIERVKQNIQDKDKNISFSKLKSIINNQNDLYKIITRLEALDIIRYKKKLNDWEVPYLEIKLQKSFTDSHKLQEFVKSVKNKKSLYKTLQTFIGLQKTNKTVFVDDLKNANCNNASIIKLIESNIFYLQRTQSTISNQNYIKILKPIALNEIQQAALSSIQKAFALFKPVLLYGITASGKTLIYINLIKDSLLKGKQVLLLVPEINLSLQIVSRIEEFFHSDIIFCYHSNLTLKEKSIIWNRIQENVCKIIIGTRSAIFLPFNDLDLIIIDEEHDGSYKQDNFPYYNAKNAAHFLAKIHKANLLLGSATPSIESYYNTLTNKYSLAQLNKRFMDANGPKVTICDLNKNVNKEDKDFLLSDLLIEKIKNVLEAKSQIILFQNRRGYAPVLICKNCKSIAKCVACDVSLVYHKSSNRLKCHYCGFTDTFTNRCPKCSSGNIEFKGKGTEKIEESLKKIFPKAAIQRVDTDSIKQQNFSTIITKFEDKEIDILVGTQIISKGIDFSNVGLVGIVDADSILNFPDFRAFEKSFQIISQVSGRAGRKGKKSEVIIQTYQPENPVINYIKNNDYESLITDELELRKLFNYPPYTRLINIIVKGKSIELVNKISNSIAKKLDKQYTKEILGPEEPLIAYINYEHSKNILIKINNNLNILKECKNNIQKTINTVKKEYKIYNAKNILLNINVDY